MVSCFVAVNRLNRHLGKQKFIPVAWKCHIDWELWLVDFDLCLFAFFGKFHGCRCNYDWLAFWKTWWSWEGGGGEPGLDFQRENTGVQVCNQNVWWKCLKWTRACILLLLKNSTPSIKIWILPLHVWFYFLGYKINIVVFFSFSRKWNNIFDQVIAFFIC